MLLLIWYCIINRSSEENFEAHYSPLVGYVGSRCDYLKMKLDTLKKHLKNLGIQTQTVLEQSLVEEDENGAGQDGQSKSGNFTGTSISLFNKWIYNMNPFTGLERELSLVEEVEYGAGKDGQSKSSCILTGS